MYYLCPFTLLIPFTTSDPLSCCEWYPRWWFWPGSVGTWPLDGQEFTNLELGPAAFDTSAAGTLINMQNWFVLFHNVFIHLHAILGESVAKPTSDTVEGISPFVHLCGNRICRRSSDLVQYMCHRYLDVFGLERCMGCLGSGVCCTGCQRSPSVAWLRSCKPSQACA